MYLTISAPDQQIFEGIIEKVTLPGSQGTFQVFKDHAPLVTTLVKGTILYQTHAKAHALAIKKGLIELADNHITILLESDDL